MLFKDFVKAKALEDKLPFELDIEPIAHDGPFVKIGRFQLPQYNELLTREAWFMEVLASSVGQRRIELQIEIFSLAKLLKEELGLENDSVALKTLSELMGGDAEQPEVETEEERSKRQLLADQKQSFFMRHLGRFTKLSDMVAATEEGAVESWMRITFFLLSRYDANWTFSNTAGLRKSEIAALINFINQEVNGGVLPEETTEDEEDLGKGLSNSGNPELASDRSGIRSSGKLMQAA